MDEKRIFEDWESPEAAGVSSAGLLRFLEEEKKHRDKVQFHSLVLLRHGKVVCRLNWRPYDDVTPHTLYSLSKSFCSAAAGFAVAEGRLSWDSRVAEVLADEVPGGERPDLAPVTLEHLLCMGSGLEPGSDSMPSDPKDSWARHVLAHKVIHEPMSFFHYNTLGTYLVSCMVQRAVGESVRDYLVPRLFEPLGIPGKPVWAASPQGISCGGFGLQLSSEHIARFGQCLLQKGAWRGKQVLPAGWVERATAWHIDNSNGHPDPDNEWNQGYGYQFWRCTEGRYRGDGAMGQVCMVDERLDAVLAVTCAARDMGDEFAMIRRFLFPTFDAEPGTAAEQTAFRRAAEELGYPLPADDGSGVPLPTGTYVLLQEGEQPLNLTLTPEPDDAIRLRLNGDQSGCLLGRGAWREVSGSDFFGCPLRYLGAYGWEGGKLHAVVRSVADPTTLDAFLTWDEDSLTMEGFGVIAPDGRTVWFRKNG